MYPDIIQTLAPGFNGDASDQLATLAGAGWILDFAGNMINQIKDGQAKAALDSITAFESTLLTFRDVITGYENDMNTKVKYEKNIKKFDTMLGTLVGITIFITIVNLIVLYKGVQKHKNNYKL